MIKCVLTFVSGVQESILVDFSSPNTVKILHKVKICQNCLYQKFPYKNEQSVNHCVLFYLVLFESFYLFYFNLFE